MNNTTKRQMSDTQMALWTLANSIGIGAEYTRSTRNPDDAIRAQFKADRGTRGTRAWAICLAMTLANGNPSDDDCAEAARVLSA